ncbi:dihydrodipicolinate synthase family protein [Cohnella phaseoli]|uniref:4-hydroxy-tetrahydrodipicolinate synthase n=1 Tax=Cohnella phaseoli TaxID=456490 RepID=A0A3D9HTP4_9BACL|nr:dihydrodipicolinate synthase family protein [Cohnella phaseoli]RED52795.1 4-hydroxy-tetrahydrodipicolinate synthase [Cohnella phaseoli]
MSNGYYPALGTPLDRDGSVLTGSLIKHVEDQIGRKAEGLLVMGSMGMQPMIKDSEYAKVAQIAAEAARGQCPVYAGVMDNSVARVKDRIERLQGIKLEGVVTTVPFYFQSTQTEIIAFYRAIADTSPYPLYLYDLPGVTQCKIQAATVIELMRHPNIRGIKSGDLALVRGLSRSLRDVNPEFEVIYSGLDTFDVAYSFGITRTLDGMFSCTSQIAERMYEALQAGNLESAAGHLDSIVGLRNLFVEVGVFPGFTHAMNLLGFEGDFHPDYSSRLNPQQADKVESYMRQIRLI